MLEPAREGFRYDRHGNLLAYTDGNGVVWTMEYGPFDLPVARTDGEGHRWQYRYDKDTLQLTEVINPQGESYLYVLDNCGRVTEEHDWGGGSGVTAMTPMASVPPGLTAWRKPSSTAGMPQAARQKSSRRKAKRSMPMTNPAG